MKHSDYNYGTHLPVLLEYILKTTGPILEIGSGIFSTPILTQFSDHRSVVSIETVPEWRYKYAGPGHKLVATWDEAIAINPYYDIVLFDGPVPRTLTKRMIEHGWLWIIHDVEDGQYQYPFGLFHFRETYQRLRPWTMVASNKAFLPEHTDGTRAVNGL